MKYSYIFRVSKLLQNKCFCKTGSRSITSDELVKVLEDLTGVSDPPILNAKKKYKPTMFTHLEEDRIRKVHLLLKKFGITDDDVFKYPNVLAIHPTTLINHCMVLEESSCVIKPNILISFYRHFKRSLSFLREKGFINDIKSVRDSYSKNLPTSLEVPVFLEEEKLLDIHVKMLKSLIAHLFNENQSVSDNFPQRLSYKSMRLISKSFDLLSNGFEIPIEKLRNCLLLLTILPEDLEDTLSNAPILCGCTVQEVAQRWPKILMTRWEGLLQISQYLENAGVTKTMIMDAPAVFTLHPKNVENRLMLMQSDPQLMEWLNSPKFLRVLFYQNKIVGRLKKLKEANRKCYSVSLLHSRDNVFRKYIEILPDRTLQSDLVKYLSNVFCVDVQKIRKNLKRHQYWLHIPMREIQESLSFLQEQGFSNEEIFANIVIILYPRKVLEEELPKLYSREDLEICKNPDNGELQRKTILPLLLYFIEVPYHFSKDAIWTYKTGTDSECSNQFV